MRAMLLAAGFGTRMRPLTCVMPKAMIPVLNRPLIGWIVEHVVAEGADEIVVNLHHFPEAVERYLRRAFPDDRFFFSYEPDLLGTGGGVRKARALLEGEEDFFLANGDTIQRPPFRRLREARRSADALAALTLRHSPPGDSYTAVWLDAGRITGFGGRTGRGEALMFSGAHCVSRRLFDLLPDQPVSELVTDVYRPGVARGAESLAGLLLDDPYWFDVGTPARYLGATRALLGTGSQVAPSARVSGRVIRSVVGARSVVEGSIEESAVWDDCRIGPAVLLANCIVGHGVELTSGHYTSALICRDEPAIPPDYARENGCVAHPFGSASALH